MRTGQPLPTEPGAEAPAGITAGHPIVPATPPGRQ